MTDDAGNARLDPARRRVASSVWRHIWAVVGVILVVAGTWGSFLGAEGVSHEDARDAQKALVTSAAEIASTLKLSIAREQDLNVEISALFIRYPLTTEAQFLAWVKVSSAFARYPELLGVSELAMVPASALSAFEAREQLDPPGPLGPSGTYQVVPAGNRPYYCLETATAHVANALAVPTGFDYCTSTGRYFTEAADTGKSLYIPYKSGRTENLGMGSAIYQGGSVPATVAQRRQQLVGWTGLDVVPGILLSSALADHPNTSVSFANGSGASRVAFTAGRRPAHSESFTVNLHNGWTVEVFVAARPGGIFGNGDAEALLFTGVVTSLLLGCLIYLLGSGRSRARRKLDERTRQLQFQALHDPLTGLPNRALILDRAEQILARSRRSGVPAAALFIDLDDFKDINDAMGHSAGDELLVAVAGRLTGALREGDSVGRLGGDEFVLLVEGSHLASGAEVVAERILAVLATPLQLTGAAEPMPISASIGVAVGPRDTPDELLRDADIALYRAKEAGKGCAVVFAPAMQTADQDRRLLNADLHNALEAGHFFLLYQPTVDLSTGAVTGVEALLRWQRPGQGVILPDDFIPALESNGLIVPVGAWVLEEACRQAATWHANGHRFTMSVNVSVRQLEHERFVGDVRLALAVSGLDPALLILELTETALMHDVDETLARLEQLKGLGVRLAIDDFGTGYSSLAYLRRFPIDVLKIDRSFISGMADSVESTALIHTLVQLGKVLNLETIAEGIEDDEQRLRLQAEDVDTGQGFLFSRPLAATDVEGFFAASSGHPVGTASA